VDEAVPLVGASVAIRTLRERIARVAATDFTVLIEGGIDPQPHFAEG
jgi:DNA-binding NtrC family response regulator